MLYFRGCTAREKEPSISEASEILLKMAGINYHILDNEICCGSVLLRTGFIKEAKEQITKNMELLKDETVITSCAGCYKTLSEDYDGLDVIHISQLLDSLIKEGKLKFNKKNLNVTFHDSCHLARHCGIIEQPRNVIKNVANIIEMANIKENALCCGAGGGVKSAFPHIATTLAENRINEAKGTNCEILITCCPFCKLNLENDDLKVLDLTEFLIEYGDKL